MDQPEDAASPAMRRVFEELEAEFEAALRREADQETAAALRAGIGEAVLWEQLARRTGSQAVAHAGAAASAAWWSPATPSSSSSTTATAPST
jgi:hypothetical protein